MTTLVKKINKIFHKIKFTPNLEAALIGSGFYSYIWYRFRYFILTASLFYIFFFIKNIFLGEDYTSFYTTTIIMYEQLVFWLSQAFWFFIVAIQKDRLNISKTPILVDKKVALIYALIVASAVGFTLYRNGLIVFEHISVYSLVSAIFIIQIFAVIYLKYMHAHIYAHKRVFVNVPIVITFAFLSVVLQIVLWNIYAFWSIPIIFGVQVIISSFVRYFFYQKEFKSRLVENYNLIRLKMMVKNLLSKSFLISVIILLPEIFYFCLVRFKFIDNAPYSTVFVLLSVIINSRLSGLLLQDFIKYDTDKYNSLMTKYLRRILIPIFLALIVLYAQIAIVNKMTSHFLNEKLIIFSFICSYFISVQYLLAYYFYSKKNLTGISVLSIFSCTTIYFSINFLQANNYVAGSALLILSTLAFVLLCLNLEKFSHFLLGHRLFLYKNFKYLVSKKNIPFIYEIHLDQISVYSKKMSVIFEDDLRQDNLIYIANSKKIFLATVRKSLNPQMLFYCKKVIKHISCDTILHQDQIVTEIQVDNFEHISHNPYNLKILFSGLVKQQAGFRKRLLSK